mmetsp:Transcript_23682/g.73781  ORF Transcript_23682/g.73781 Transcript_23682/m.73781 type:complete len:217 (+) Transcript_23682:33-683(+)
MTVHQMHGWRCPALRILRIPGLYTLGTCVMTAPSPCGCPFECPGRALPLKAASSFTGRARSGQALPPRLLAPQPPPLPPEKAPQRCGQLVGNPGLWGLASPARVVGRRPWPAAAGRSGPPLMRCAPHTRGAGGPRHHKKQQPRHQRAGPGRPHHTAGRHPTPDHKVRLEVALPGSRSIPQPARRHRRPAPTPPHCVLHTLLPAAPPAGYPSQALQC